MAMHVRGSWKVSRELAIAQIAVSQFQLFPNKALLVSNYPLVDSWPARRQVQSDPATTRLESLRQHASYCGTYGGVVLRCPQIIPPVNAS